MQDTHMHLIKNKNNNKKKKTRTASHTKLLLSKRKLSSRET
jgi:hypothetical protein